MNLTDNINTYNESSDKQTCCAEQNYKFKRGIYSGKYAKEIYETDKQYLFKYYNKNIKNKDLKDIPDLLKDDIEVIKKYKKPKKEKGPEMGC